jgi:RHS repeat-associated protein
MVDADGHTTAYAYDKDGNMTSLSDADGHAVSWTYDGQGHRLTQANRSTGSVNWTYDEAGRLASRSATGVPTVTYGYDLGGNRITVTSGSQVISTTYDPLGRPLTVTDSSDPGAATTYTYGLASATRTDPSSASAYTFALDAFGRETGIVDPVHGAGSPWTTAYAADGQPTSLAAPDGNTTAYGYDPAGRLLTISTTAGATHRADYTYAYNAAGQRLTENSQVTGDTANGTASFAYDPLGRITSFSGLPAFANQGYTWDKVPNRLSKTVGASSVTTTFDAANRPVTDTTPATYGVDADGRITSRPVAGGSETLAYDSLGRLASATVGGVTTTYTYDPLDRLVTVTRGSAVARLRYVGTTTTIAQVRDGSDAVQYNLATSLAGEPRFDFTPGGATQRFYGTNGHHDVTWTASASGAVASTERYDPWGSQTVSSGSLPDLRFQGSWFDATTGLAWAVNRWYAPDLGTFTSEDAVLGQHEQPETRQLYAYGAGDPVGRADPDGQYWYKVGAYGRTFASLATTALGSGKRWPMIWNANRNRWRSQPAANSVIPAGVCVWIPIEWFYYQSDVTTYNRSSANGCPSVLAHTSSFDIGSVSRKELRDAQWRAQLGDYRGLFSFTRTDLYAATARDTGHHARVPTASQWRDYNANAAWLNSWIRNGYGRDAMLRSPCYYWQGRIRLLSNGGPWFCYGNPCTVGQTIFLNGWPRTDSLLSHEYIHVLQFETGGTLFGLSYVLSYLLNGDPGPTLGYEAVPYAWQAWIDNFGAFEVRPWRVWRGPW